MTHGQPSSQPDHPPPRVRAVEATIQLLKHAPTEAIAPVLLESQRVSKEKPDPRDEVGLMVRRSTTGNNRNVISKRLRVAMTRAKDVFHLMVLQRFFTTPASAR
jgi:hypothetical protein